MEQKSIFFSYNRRDSKFALNLAKDLIANSQKIWIDQLNIRTGERWDKSVESALLNASIFLVILSPLSVASENVLDEINLAIKKEKKIVPVISKSCEIPFRLERFQYIDFTKDYSKALDLLLQELNVSKNDRITKDRVNKKIILPILVAVTIILSVIVVKLNLNHNSIYATISPFDTSRALSDTTQMINVNDGDTKDTIPDISKVEEIKPQVAREMIKTKYRVSNDSLNNPARIDARLLTNISITEDSVFVDLVGCLISFNDRPAAQGWCCHANIDSLYFQLLATDSYGYTQVLNSSKKISVEAEIRASTPLIINAISHFSLTQGLVVNIDSCQLRAVIHQIRNEGNINDNYIYFPKFSALK